MKIMGIRGLLVPVKKGTLEVEKQPPVDGKNQEQVKVIEFFWTCDKCKYRNSHRIRAKNAYNDKDLLLVAKGVFNLAHYDCACEGEAVVHVEEAEAAKHAVSSTNLGCAEASTPALSASGSGGDEEVNK